MNDSSVIDRQPVTLQEKGMPEYIPFSHHVTPTIVATKNAEYLSVWRLAGRSHQSASKEECTQWIYDLNNIIKGIASPSVALWTHIVRRQVNDYPEAHFDNIFCQQLDEKYKQRFQGVKLMVNDLYLTVVYRPAEDGVLSFFAQYEKATEKKKREMMEMMRHELEEINRTLSNALRRYDAHLLGVYEYNGHIYSEAVEFLAYLINNEHIRIPLTRDRFCNYIARNRPFFSKWGSVGEIRSPISGSRFFSLLEIREYDERSLPGHFDGLLGAKFEFVLSQSFSMLSKAAAKSYLKRHQKLLRDSGDASEREVKQIRDAINDVAGGSFILGEHHAVLAVFAETENKLQNAVGDASSILQEAAVVPRPVDLALEAGFWSQLPGNWKWRPRPAPISSFNFLCFSSFHNYMSGKPNGNPWGPAISCLQTTAKTPYYLNFHASKDDEDSTEKRLLGNTAVIGQSGSGKTALVGFFLAQATKLKPTVVVFDKDRGQELTIRALGGQYLPLQLGEKSGFNPLQMDLTPANIIAAKQIIKKLVSTSGEIVTSHEEKEIDTALAAVMNETMPFEKRRLSMLLEFLPNPITKNQDRPTIHARLLRWCEGGEYGWLFDNERDLLDLSTYQIYGFDITAFLDIDEIRTPTMMYLLHRTEGMIDGIRRFIYILEEFWKLVLDPVFEDLARNKLKTIRKQNGLFLFITQEPSDALQSSIAKTLVQQCATYIFLANPAADKDDYVNGFKLTEKEFELIKNLGEFSRTFLVKQGANSALVELDLSGLDDELLILSATLENADMAEELISEIGGKPEVWLPEFWRRADASTERKIK